MKIEKIVKKKSSLYELYLSNGEKISLYDDVILKYELLLKKEIAEDKLTEILNYNSYLESYNIALKFISSKLRVEKEIRNKLKDYSKDAVNYTIERLKKENLLNDQIYIKAYINDEVNLKFIGPNNIYYNLKKLGFKDDDIKNYLVTFASDIWQSKIKKYIDKKIKSNNNLSPIMLKLKVTNDLLNKGFYKEDINKVLNETSFNFNQEIYDREYLKLKNKLSKKYSGNELEYYIKMKLKQKGF